MIISIAHQKGGVGKSTLALNLIHYLDKYNPVLIDLDMQNTISYANKIREGFAKPFNVKIIDTDETLKELFRSSKKNNLIIIDTGGFDSSLNRLAIMGSDLIISPVSNQGFELLGLKKFESILQELSKIKKNTIKAHVLLNNINPTVKNLDDLYAFINGSPHFNTFKNIIRQRADIAHSSSNGLAVGEYKSGSKADIELKAAAAEIEKLVFN